MKKTTRNIAIVMLLAVMLISLTGCFGNKLVATRESDEMGVKVKETMEVTFKNDKANEVKATYEFDKTEDADMYYGLMSAFFPDGSTEQKGKKIIMTLKAEDFLGEGEEADGASKEEIKKQLEEQGYKVK